MNPIPSRLIGRAVFFFDPTRDATGAYLGCERIDGVIEDAYLDAGHEVVFVVRLTPTSRLVAVPLDKTHLTEAKP